MGEVLKGKRDMRNYKVSLNVFKYWLFTASLLCLMDVLRMMTDVGFLWSMSMVSAMAVIALYATVAIDMGIKDSGKVVQMIRVFISIVASVGMVVVAIFKSFIDLPVDRAGYTGAVLVMLLLAICIYIGSGAIVSMARAVALDIEEGD